MSDEIRVIAIFPTLPHYTDRVVKALQRCAIPSRAEIACHFYTVNREIDEPSRVVMIEHWASQAALDAHMQTPHFKKLVEEIDGLLSAPIEMTVLAPEQET